MTSETPVEPVKRGRGRPRKPDSEKKQKPRQPDDGMPRRGRGRPKGSLNKPKALTAPAGVSKSSAATRRTPPRKINAAVAAPVVKNPVASGTPGKRGPGRPRKSDVAAASPATPRDRPSGLRALRASGSAKPTSTTDATPVKAKGRRKSDPAATEEDKA
ncbi:hypothetical protein ACHAQH_001549 [Verticillium albo-atrum]